MTVVLRDGENIGKIQDLKIDARNGRVNYVTVEKGGEMGVEGIPVPLAAFQFTKENAKLTVDKSKLDNAPKQSNMSDQEFQRDLENHYGISPTWSGGQSDSSMGGQSTSPNSEMDTGTGL
jgi:sporulation protein YlmC with PRC-barrel domain